jgi:hypothetical protein
MEDFGGIDLKDQKIFQIMCGTLLMHVLLLIGVNVLLQESYCFSPSLMMEF